MATAPQDSEPVAVQKWTATGVRAWMRGHFPKENGRFARANRRRKLAGSEFPDKNELACSLTDAELRERRRFVRTALLPHVEGVEQAPLRVVMRFGPSIAEATVREFVELESVCCGFLNFDVANTGSGIELRIDGPAGSEPVLDTFANAARGAG